MRFNYGRTPRFHLGLEVYESLQHVRRNVYQTYIGLCLAFGFWHIDIEVPRG